MRRRYSTFGIIGAVISLIVPCALILLFYSLYDRADIMTRIFERVTVPVRTFIAGLCDKVPFSVAEAFYVVLIVWAVCYVIKTLMLLFTYHRRLRMLIVRVLTLACVAAWIWTGFLWLWSTGYYAPNFSEKSGLSSEGATVEQLYSAAEEYIALANELAGALERDENGDIVADIEYYFDNYDSVYDNILGEFPCLQAETFRPKDFFFSRVLSYVGFTGFYFPMTGETNINTDCPPVYIPSTVAHEMAHQRGVNGEAEANFVAIAACVTSDITEFRYAGALSGLIHLTNAVYSADYEAWQTLRSTYSDLVVHDIAQNSAYWAEIEDTKFNDVSTKVYDGFLKVNDQTLGIKSYGACVDLLVKWTEIHGGI